MPDPTLFILIGAVVVVVLLLAATLKIIRQQQVALVERLGKFRKALEPGPHLVVPFFDQVRYTLDMREQVVPFPPQGVITEDNLMVSIARSSTSRSSIPSAPRTRRRTTAPPSSSSP